MPRYDYRCPKCDEDVPVIKPMSQAEQPEPCPICKRIMQRVFSPVAARVKGGTRNYHGPAWK